MWNKFKNLDYNVKLTIFYTISVYLIIFFIWDINSISNSISNNEFYVQTINNNILDYEYTNSITYDYNLTLGGAIRSIALDIIQIIFLVLFILVLYIHEVYNGNK